MRATSACAPTTPPCCRPAAARCWSRTRPTPTRIAYAAMRALKERVETVCFITGHGETFRPTPAHFHYSHVETLRGHDKPGAGDVLEAEPEQLDRLQLALTEIGYRDARHRDGVDERHPAGLHGRRRYRPAHRLCRRREPICWSNISRAAGGCCCCSIRCFRSVPTCRSACSAPSGSATEPAIVIDPLNHFRTDPDKVAVPYYPPHPITERLALTVFPQARPIRLTPPPAGVRTVHSRRQQPGQLSAAASAAGGTALASAEQATPDAEDRGAQALAVAVEGRVAGRAPGQAFPSGGRRHQQIRQQRIFPLRLQRRAFGRDAALARGRRDDAERSRRKPISCRKSSSPTARCATCSSRLKCCCRSRRCCAASWCGGGGGERGAAPARRRMRLVAPLAAGAAHRSARG